MGDNPALVWFGLDLRLADNPALERAIARECAVRPMFIWAPEEESPWSPGAASRWWLQQSLAELQVALPQRGSKLTVRRRRELPYLQFSDPGRHESSPSEMNSFGSPGAAPASYNC